MPNGKKIVFLQAGTLEGLRAQILGASQPIEANETFTLVADGLIARFEAKENVASRIHSISPGQTFEVLPGRPKLLTASASIDRFGLLIQGPLAVFEVDIIPLMAKFCPCCEP